MPNDNLAITSNLDLSFQRNRKILKSVGGCFDLYVNHVNSCKNRKRNIKAEKIYKPEMEKGFIKVALKH